MLPFPFSDIDIPQFPHRFQVGAIESDDLLQGLDGPRMVVEAVAFGKKAAVSIDRYLKGQNIRDGLGKDWKAIEFEPDHVERATREQMFRLPLAERDRTFKEVDLGFNEEQARREADRCLRLCGMQRAKKSER